MVIQMIDRYILFMFLSVIISSFSQILLKKSAKIEHKNFFQEYLNPLVIIGYGMMIVSTLTTLMAYRGMDYKNGPIIESLGYILVMILSYLFFREKISKKKIIGYFLILLGVIVFYI